MRNISKWIRGTKQVTHSTISNLIYVIKCKHPYRSLSHILTIMLLVCNIGLMRERKV
jgi:hypothetical protein